MVAGARPVHAKACGDLDSGFCQSKFRRVLPVGAAVAFSSNMSPSPRKSEVRGKRHLAGSEHSAVPSKFIDGDGNIIAPGSWGRHHVSYINSDVHRVQKTKKLECGRIRMESLILQSITR